jgi:serine/threonine protein kinase
LLFFEFIEGGTLSEWIDRRKLLTTASILDIAIQIAWGLDFIHEHQLVYQDVKPQNVLMTTAGTVKLTDFGLVGLPERSTAFDASASSGNKKRVTGFTQPFCSPEQKNGKPVDVCTDIWSWGLTVLAMYNGGVTWSNGEAAATTLDSYLVRKSRGKSIEQMSLVVAGILRRCFERDTADRWASFQDIAETCQRVYRSESGLGYARTPPSVAPSQTVRIAGDDFKSSRRGSSHRLDRSLCYERKTRSGQSWKDPVVWLELALGECVPNHALSPLFPVGGSRPSQIISDLAAYDEVSTIFEKHTPPSTKEWKIQLACFFDEKASLHESANDLAGMMHCLNKAIAVRDELVRDAERSDLVLSLALSCLRYAECLANSGRVKHAIERCDKTIRLLQSLGDQGLELANAYSARGRYLIDTMRWKKVCVFWMTQSHYIDDAFISTRIGKQNGILLSA